MVIMDMMEGRDSTNDAIKQLLDGRKTQLSVCTRQNEQIVLQMKLSPDELPTWEGCSLDPGSKVNNTFETTWYDGHRGVNSRWGQPSKLGARRAEV